MSLESIYRYTPKGKPSVRSFKDYVSKKFPDSATSRTKNFNSQIQLLNNVFDKHKAESSKTIKKSLAGWLATPVEGVHTSILMQADDEVLSFDNPDWLVASTYARECPNVKSILRNVNNRFTERSVDSDRRFLYDFEVLENDLKKRSSDTLYIIHLEDTDVFDAQVINELIIYMHAYPDLPIRLVLSLSGSTAAFEERLHRENLENMEIRLFEQTDNSGLLEDVVDQLNSKSVYIGIDLQFALSTRSQEEILKVFKYFLMVYYSTNPLASLDKTNVSAHLSIIRRLPSFREIATKELIQNDGALVGVVESALDTVGPNYSGFMRELVISDVELYHNAFNPNYRHALETALAEPRYFYPFETPNELTARIPVCALYSLVRVADLYLNIYDHYVEFKDIMVRPEGVSDEQWPRLAAAWYQQAVAELAGSGIIRPTKRKANSLEKIAYKGV